LKPRPFKTDIRNEFFRNLPRCQTGHSRIRHAAIVL